MNTYINYCGSSDSGKTTTLTMLIQRFKNMASFHLIKEESNPSRKGNPPDYRIAFDINLNGTKYVIAISTHGDNLENLFLNHRFFDQYAPKIMITASHAHTNHGHNLFIDNYVHNDIDASNEFVKYRGSFNYVKIESKKYNLKDKTKEQQFETQRNQTNCNDLYDLTMISLNI